MYKRQPLQAENLVGDDAARSAKLRSRLAELAELFGESKVIESDAPMDAGARRQLEHLGYAGD